MPYYEVPVLVTTVTLDPGPPPVTEPRRRPSLPAAARRTTGRGDHYGSTTYLWFNDTVIPGLTALTDAEVATKATAKAAAALRDITDVLSDIQGWSLGRSAIVGARPLTTDDRVRFAALRAQIKVR